MTARTSLHWRRSLPLLLACIAGSTLAQAAPTLGNGIAVPPGLALKLPAPTEAALTLLAPDRAKLAREDAAATEGRYRYAVPMPVKSAATQAKSARWETLPDGRRRWAFLVEADGAETLDLIFSRYWLPNGGELWVRSPEHELVHGPYTDAHNSQQGVLATPVTQGGKTLVEIVVPAGLESHVELELGTVHYGYRGFTFEGGVPVPKAGSCNVDTVCPQGDAWRDQIRGVGRYTVGGGLCTGTLVNNSAGDRRPLFLTARHCFSSQADANTVVVFWRYESPTCRTVNSAANGQVIPLNHTATNSGSQLLMSFGNADMTLVALNQPVPAAAQPYFVGWDRRDVVPNSAVAIHHPAGDEKRISFENNPLALSSFSTGSINLAQGAALRVNDWDLGTTEQGSSGSALFNPEKRLVGTLAGGSAQCGNDLDDNYGRVFIGWTGGGAASSRLSDHLAPGGVAPQTVDGLDGAAGGGPSVTVTVRPGATVQAGTDSFVDVTVNGTGAPFSVAVDLEGDGITDRTLTGVAAGQVQSLPVRFPRQANYTVRATATGSGGTASGQFGVAVTAHDVRATFGSTAQQLCGDGDGLVEPGEQWRLPVSLFNAGANPTTTQNSWSIFGKALSGPGGAGGTPLATDAFGYTLRDTATGSCGYQFIDLTQVPEATPLTLTATSPNFPATDDGASNALNLGATYSFELYGQTVSTIKIGTNGYISTNSGITGGDFTPNCNASPVSDGGGLRLNALHADLVINDIRALGYTNCPRPSNVGAANQPCLIVQWSGARQFVNNGSPSGNFDLQAIIYPQSRAIIYQTRGTFPTTTEFPGSTIGLQRVPTSALNYTCTAARRPIQTSNAVCYYHPASQPGTGGAAVNPTQLRLLTPAVGLNGAVSGSTTQRNVDVHLARDLACGSTARIRYLGTVDERAYSGVITESTLNVGGTGCAAVTTCPEPANTVSLKAGAHFNPARAGNGLLPYPAGQVGGLPQFFVPWFTAEANRNPTWYALQSTAEQNQITSPILRFARNGNPPTWVVPTSAAVGQAQVTLVETGQLVLTHQFTGQNAGGERMIALLPAQAPSPNRTGAWFNPAEAGWGITFDTFAAGGVPNDFIATFFYDTAGAPRWATAQGPAGQLTAQVLTPHCPNCIWTDADPTRRNIGTLNRNFSGPRNGTFTINVDTGAPQQVLWQRNAMPFELLTDLIP
jgi:lysyl endopeptidase